MESFMVIKSSVLLSFILSFTICEGSLASGIACADVFQKNSANDFSTQSLAEKIQTLKQVLVRFQSEVAAEKKSLVEVYTVDSKVDSIVSKGAKAYAQGFYEIPGLPSRRLSNAEIAEQVTLEINNSQTWKQNISRMKVESLLYYGSAGQSGASNTSFLALLLRYQGMYKGETPDAALVNSAVQLLKKDSDLQKLDSLIRKAAATGATSSAKKYRTSHEAEDALLDFAFTVVANAGIPKTLLKPYLELTKKYADEGGPRSQDDSTYNQVIDLLNASLTRNEITQEIYHDLKGNLWMYGQLPNDLFRSYQRQVPNDLRTQEAELRSIVQILNEIESMWALIGEP